MKNKKFIFGGFISVLLLGILTNVIWEVLKPVTTYLFKVVLNLSVLGIEKFKDNIYVEIAKGMHEGASVQVFLLLHSIILSFVFMSILLMIIKRREIAPEEGNRTHRFLDKIYFYQKDLTRKSWFPWFFLLYVLFFGTIFTLDSVK